MDVKKQYYSVSVRLLIILGLGKFIIFIDMVLCKCQNIIIWFISAVINLECVFSIELRRSCPNFFSHLLPNLSIYQ